MSEFIELEYKYKADNVSLSDFKKTMQELNITKTLDVSSWDSYYTKGSEEFVRFRNSATDPELTIKRKTKNSNNWVRTEVDLALNKNKINDETVSNFLELLNYKKNFKIYKSCFIFWTDDVNFVYYIVYNEDMKELGRFIEVEVNKNKASTVEHSISILNDYEKELGSLGISAQNRLKKSLFEMYVRS